MLSHSWTFFALRGFIFRDIHKMQGESSSNSAIKYKKYVAGKYTRALTSLVRKHTSRIFESKDGWKSTKPSGLDWKTQLCWNDLLIKSNRTEIETYKVEERTLGTPCICDSYRIQKMHFHSGERIQKVADSYARSMSLDNNALLFLDYDDKSVLVNEIGSFFALKIILITIA